MKIDLNNKNILSFDGKVLAYSLESFIADICEKDVCFICGAGKEEKAFNDEHIIPRWVLKRFDLFNKTITLPNRVTFPYGRYVMRCCQECNSFLGENIEDVISVGLSDDYEKSLAFFEDNKKLIFVWMCLLLIKRT